MDKHGEAHESLIDQVPGDTGRSERLRSLVIGLLGSVLLTAASFWAAETPDVWRPSVPILLAALAIAQMGVHLVFFLHISSAPDQANNFLSLAFGVLVVGLVVFGSMLIMSNLETMVMPMSEILKQQR